VPQQLRCGTENNIRFRNPDGTFVTLEEWALSKYTQEDIDRLAKEIGEAIRKQLDKPVEMC
jgi:hypothetical protein